MILLSEAVVADYHLSSRLSVKDLYVSMLLVFRLTELMEKGKNPPKSAGIAKVY